MSYNRLQHLRRGRKRGWTRATRGIVPFTQPVRVKGFEGRNFEIHPRVYNHETFYFQRVSDVKRKPRLKATLCYLLKPYGNNKIRVMSQNILRNV